MSYKSLLLTAAALLPCVALAGFPTFYVATNGNNANDCTSPVTACASIQFVYDNLITVTPAEIRVLPGTYHECVQLWGFNGNVPSTDKPVRLVAEAWINNGDNTTTILDGTGACDGIAAIAEPVVSIGGTSGAAVEGFTITGGGNSGVFGQGSVAITNNVITGNTGPLGGGVYLYTATCYYSGSIAATIANNEISENFVEDLFQEGAGAGGGVYVWARGFESSASCQGGSVSVTISQNTITDNVAENFTIDPLSGDLFTTLGAGVFALTESQLPSASPPSFSASAVTISQNTITGNSQTDGSAGYGAGIWASSTGLGLETIEIEGNSVSGNTASFDGGGISAWVQMANDGKHTLRVHDNTITGNTATFNGGGLDLFMFVRDLNAGDRAVLNAYNNDISGNEAGFDGGGILASLNSERSLDAADAATFPFPNPFPLADEISFTIRANRVDGNTSGIGGGGMSLLPTANADPDSDFTTTPPFCDVPGFASAKIDLSGNSVTGNTARAEQGVDVIGGGLLVLPAARGKALAAVTIDRTTVAGNSIFGGFVGGIETQVLTELQCNSSFVGETAMTLTDSIVGRNQGGGVGGPLLGPNDNLTFDASGNYVFGNGTFNYETTIFPCPNPPCTPPGNPTADPQIDPMTFVPDVCSAAFDSGAGFLSSPDFNGDNGVDGVDILNLAVAFSARLNESPTLPDPRYEAATDLDSDGIVDGDDLAVMAAEFGRVCAP